MIIYTRFNSRRYNLEYPTIAIKQKSKDKILRRMNQLRFDEHWLSTRIKLFNTYTSPSVLSQTNQQFRWIGIIHPNSPKWFIEEIKKIPKIEPRLCEFDIEAKEDNTYTTINLDSDDAIAKNFIAETKKIKFKGEIVFLKGLKYRILTRQLIEAQSPTSHFNIVRDPKLSVLDFPHGSKNIPRKVINISEPMWLEVIHEKNICNQLKPTKITKNLEMEYLKKYINIDIPNCNFLKSNQYSLKNRPNRWGIFNIERL